MNSGSEQAPVAHDWMIWNNSNGSRVKGLPRELAEKTAEFMNREYFLMDAPEFMREGLNGGTKEGLHIKIFGPFEAHPEDACLPDKFPGSVR